VGSILGPGEFTDTNSLLLAARASQAGAIPVVADVQPDDPDVLAAAAREAALGADLVLVIAGSSRGRGDFTAIEGVAVQPGHPVLLGYVKPGRSGPPLPGGERASHPPGTVPAIGVPGYPAGRRGDLRTVRRAALAQLQGSRVDQDRLPLHARLGCHWSSPTDVEDWVLVSLNVATEAAGLPGDHLIATPVKGRGAGAISRLVRADAWWRIPIGQGQFASGTDIQVWPTSS
jgi:putative molybdopterin biosynthesis protein